MEIKEALTKYGKQRITNWEKAGGVFSNILQAEDEIDQDKEHFWVMGLTTKKTIKYVELVSLGTLNATLIHPREVFRMAIFKGVDSILIAHNHPSGDVSPSREDKEITTNLIKAGKILQINVIDHLIITTDKEFYSFHKNNPEMFEKEYPLAHILPPYLLI